VSAREKIDSDGHVRVSFLPDGRYGSVEAGTTLRDAARALGIEIESICGGRGTCAKCKVRVLEGSFDEQGIESSQQHVSDPSGVERRARERGRLRADERLSCQARLNRNAVVYVPQESRVGRPVICKQAGQRTVTLAPAIRKCSVLLDARDSSAPGEIWDRLCEALAERFDITCSRIDPLAEVRLVDAVGEGEGELTVTLWQGDEVIRVEPGHSEHAYGIAVDLGTTTIGGFLCELTSGELVASASALNPQISFGEDIMNRIASSQGPEQLAKMQALLVDAISAIAADLALQAGIESEDIVEAVVVANTVMHHIFLGLDVRSLGVVPFAPVVSDPVDTKAHALDLRILPSGNVHLLPIEAGFVGADNVAVLIAEAPHTRDELQLIIDIGTNGEIFLGNRDRMLCASCPTGPALEGANIRYGMRAAVGAIDRIRVAPESFEVRFSVIGESRWSTKRPPDEIGALGLCGSAGIEAVAELLRAGIIDQSGRMSADIECARLRRSSDGMLEFVIAWADETAIGEDITFTQADVRAIQLAKGALYAGSELLLRRLGAERPDRVILAGAFGSVIDLERALAIGLFPDCGLKNVSAVGNAAGDGARMALLDRHKRVEAENLARDVEYVELSTEPGFNDCFVAATHIPHMSHRFSSLEPKR